MCARRKGGIIWHTQGSGKSIVMVLLAKWILENNPNARVAIITDRDELDKQIEGVFTEAGEAIKRTSSGRDLMSQLGQAKPRLLCSLVHKFGRKDVDDFDAFIKELEAQPSQTVGEVFVFVDECHRTQSGKLHRVMKAMMPNAVFIGFTGTPLLKKDKADQPGSLRRLHPHLQVQRGAWRTRWCSTSSMRRGTSTSGSAPQDKIDAWFEAKTKGLNDWQKDELKKQWGTMQKVLSSTLAHGAGGERHRLRLQREAAPFQRARQRHPGGVEHLRGVQVFHAVPEDAVQGQVRGGDLLQPAGAGRDAGGNRREHRDRQAVHLQHLHRAAEGRRSQAGHDEDRDLRGARPRRCSPRSRRT